MSTPSIPVFEARGLGKKFGDDWALRDLTLKVDPGQVVCLLGANGAGKTTTLNLFLGFLAADAGEALVSGRPVQEDPDAARALLGYLPEVIQLYPMLTGRETLEFFAQLSSRRLERAGADQALAGVGLPESAFDKRVGGYSKGMRQKLGLAIALAKGARGLLLDEPLSGLDPRAANDLVQLVRGLATSGHAVLAVTHDIFRAHQMADAIGIMREGRLVEMLDPRAMTAAQIEALYVDHLRDVA